MTADTASEDSSASPTDPIYIDGQADFDTVLNDHDVVLTDFYADWCGPCQMLEPVVETIAAETEATVAKVDVDANQSIASKFGVRGVPTIGVFADGKQVEEVVGVRSEAQLRSLVEGYTE